MLKNSVVPMIVLSVLVTISGCTEKLQSVKQDLLPTKTPEKKIMTISPESIGLTPQEEAGFDLDNDILASRKYGQAIVDAPEFSEYLNGILAKLTKNLPEFQPQPKVFIVSDEGYNAVTRENGGIFIPMDTLSNVRSEDEIAALISHEVSHIILGHFASENSRKTVDKFTDAAMSVTMLIETFKPDSNYSSTIKLLAADYLIQSSLFPAWDRSTERAADLLGVDLLLGAGYSIEGMLEFVKRVGIHEQIHEFKLADYLDNQMNVESGIGGSFSVDVGGIITSTLKKLDNKLASSYDPSQERYQSVIDYYNEHYPLRFPELKTANLDGLLNTNSVSREKLKAFKAAKISSKILSNTLSVEEPLTKAEKLGIIAISGKNKYDSYSRLVMSNVRQIQGKSDTAMRNLDIAINSGKATHGVYYKKYMLFTKQGKYGEARKVLGSIEKHFGESDLLLPEKIDLAFKQQKEVEVNSLFANCLGSSFSGKSHLLEQCELARGGQYEPIL